MRFVPQNEFFDSYKLPPSRIQWAARGAKKGAAAAGAPPALAASIDDLLQRCVEYAEKRRAWKAARNTQADPRLIDSDHRVDRSFSNFVKRVQMETDDFGPESPRGKAAAALLEGPLNVEVFSVTNATREEEESMLNVILDTIEADHLHEVRTCGLQVHFSKLQADFDLFVTEMHRQPHSTLTPTTEQLKALADKIHSKMIEVIHRANGAWPTPSEQDGLNRTHVLGPFATQNDRAGAYYRRNKGTALPEVDPQTGDDIVAAQTPDPAEPTHKDQGDVQPV